MLHRISPISIKFVAALQSIGIFDAGSTGTRLHVYSFENNKVVDFKNYKKDQENGKGIHEMKDDDIKKEINDLIEMASDQIKNISLGFFGTAGMRSLYKSRSEQVMKTVKESLKSTNLVESKIISGTEEALYVLKAFEFINPTIEKFTLIDMGGKSVQIVNRDGEQISMGSLKVGMTNRKCSYPKSRSRSVNVLSEVQKGTTIPPGRTEDGKLIDSLRIDHSLNSANNSFESNLISGNQSKTHNNNLTGIDATEAEQSQGFSITLSKCTKSNGSISCLNVYSWNDSRSNSSVNSLNTSLHATFLSADDEFEKDCIDDFFENEKIDQIKQTGPIYLISAFEYFVPTGETFILKDLYDFNNNKCAGSFKENCSELYFSIKFLEKLGIQMESTMSVPNKKEKIPISWVLGKAVEMAG